MLVLLPLSLEPRCQSSASTAFLSFDTSQLSLLIRLGETQDVDFFRHQARSNRSNRYAPAAARKFPRPAQRSGGTSITIAPAAARSQAPLPHGPDPPAPDARAAFVTGDQPLPPIAQKSDANWLLCAKCRILLATKPIVLSLAALVGNTLLRQPRTKLTRMINRASHSTARILLRKARVWYEDLPPSTALSFKTCVLFTWTIIVAAAAYSLADLMPY